MAAFTKLAALFLVLAVLKNQQILKAQFAVLTNSISVVSPLSLSSKHDAAIGMFGVQENHEGFIVGSVVYPTKGSVTRLSTPLFLIVEIWNAQRARAAAVIVPDEFVEPLIAMESPNDSDLDVYKKKVQIPSALITKYFGDSLKNAMNNNRENVVVKLEWQRLMPRLLERVNHNIDDE